VIVPSGPERGGLMNVNRGRRVVTCSLLIGDTRIGSSSTMGVKTSKLAGGEYGPLLAPSSAFTRQ
jgi:hypothetical protein